MCRENGSAGRAGSAGKDKFKRIKSNWGQVLFGIVTDHGLIIYKYFY